MSFEVAVAIVLIMVVVSTVLSAVEGVMLHLSEARAATLVDEGDATVESLLSMLGRRERTLSAVVAGRVLSQVAVVVTVVAELVDDASPPPTWIGAGLAVAVVLFLGEVVAKTVALVRTDDVALRLATVARVAGRVPPFGVLTAGVTALVGGRGDGGDDTERRRVSEEELLAFAEVAEEADVIESGERKLIESIIEFGDTIVREVMVPRPDMVTVDATWQVSDVMEVVILNGFSRIPVVGAGIDDVVGIAYAKDLMRAERDGNGAHAVARHVRQARFVPEQQRVSVLLPEMQSEQFHMAVVVDEYGGVAGLVTLEDLIEELIGEIVDEFDVEDPMAEPLPGGAYRVNARMPLDEVNDLLEADLPEGDWDTVGGLLFGSLGHVPTEGESIELETHRLTAARVQGRRIGLVRIDRLDRTDTSSLGRSIER